MKNFMMGLVVATGVVGVLLAQTKINPTDPQPTCNMCPATTFRLRSSRPIPRRRSTEKLVDQQVRSIDIGKSNVAIGIEYRTRLDKPGANSVAEHDHVSEVYRISRRLGDARARPGYRQQTASSRHAADRGRIQRAGQQRREHPEPVTRQPQGRRHGGHSGRHGPLVHQDRRSHLYFMVRIDPDKVAPLKSEAQSKAYLSKPAPTGPAGQ